MHGEFAFGRLARSEKAMGSLNEFAIPRHRLGHRSQTRAEEGSERTWVGVNNADRGCFRHRRQPEGDQPSIWVVMNE